jgi:drug/metabolite transporter (DMT)-like permease
MLSQQSFRFEKKDVWWVVTRNAAGTINLISLIYAIQYLPIGIY